MFKGAGKDIGVVKPASQQKTALNCANIQLGYDSLWFCPIPDRSRARRKVWLPNCQDDNELIEIRGESMQSIHIALV
jgi:hypothetical protein